MGRACLSSYFLFDFFSKVGVVFEIPFGTLPPLPEAGVTVREKGAGFIDDAHFDTNIKDVALLADAVVEHNVELGGAEGRGNLVLDYLSFDTTADSFVSLLDDLGASQFQSYRTVELQRPAAGGYFRITADN